MTGARGEAWCVYKVGGPALEAPELIGALAAEVGRSLERGPVTLVHGGGRQIERLLSALGVASRFVGGRRVTSAEAMEVVEMVLSGVVNKGLAAGLTAAGRPAIGLSGRDAQLIRARLEPDLGRVGVPDQVDVTLLRVLHEAGFVPVVSPVSSGPSGEAVNVNADEAALGIARALRAQRLVYLSDVEGVRAGESTLERLTLEQAEVLIADGTISGGMALKVRVALAAAAAGVGDVVIAGKARLLGAFPGTSLAATAELTEGRA